MEPGWNIIIRKEEHFPIVDIFLLNLRPDGSQQIVCPVNLEIRTEYDNTTMPEPTFKFHGTEAIQFLKSLSNALVLAGYKPDEIKASDAEKAAIINHLEDMRKLVFKKEPNDK
jgi:hypothetical protein